jgi:YD repeat-containing protein
LRARRPRSQRLGQISAITTKKDATASAVDVATGVTWRPMSGLLDGFTFGNGLTFAATYDLDYRLRTMRVKNGAADLIWKIYTFGDGANLQPNDGINLTRIADQLAAGQSSNHTYDKLSRLKTASGPWGASTYGYDATGNRTSDATTLSAVTPTKAYAYPATNNKLSSETINGTLARSMTYDGGGNLLTGLPVGASYSIVYNKRNRPATLRLNGTTVATYYYSAEEQLVSRSLVSPLTPAGFTHYVYDLEGHLIAEATGTTAATAVITREYIWLGDMPVMVIDGVNTASPVLSAVHVDHLMRPIKITNSVKASTWDATWLPWGGAHVTTGTTAMSLRFPGQYFLIEQGLAFNWHRMYDQSAGLR